jgi:hypothetical protein
MVHETKTYDLYTTARMMTQHHMYNVIAAIRTVYLDGKDIILHDIICTSQFHCTRL